MNFFETIFIFDPKKCVENTKQSAIEYMLTKMEGRTKGLTFPFKEHHSESTGMFFWKKETHTARIIIQSPDADIMGHASDRMTVKYRSSSIVEKLTDAMYGNLVPLKPDGVFIMRMDYALSSNYQKAYGYLNSRLRNYIEHPDEEFRQCAVLLGPEQTHITAEKKEIKLPRSRLGEIKYDSAFYMTVSGPLELLLDIRARLLKHPQKEGKFDDVDCARYNRFVLHVSVTDEYKTEQSKK